MAALARHLFRDGDLTDFAIYCVGMACVGAVLLAINAFNIGVTA